MNCENPLSCHSSTGSLDQPSSDVKSNQQESESFLPTRHDGETGCNSVITDVDGPYIHLQKLKPTRPDLLHDGAMDSLTATCLPSMESIFSPNFEHGDLQLKPTNTDDKVKQESPKLPHLVVDESDDGPYCLSEEQSSSLSGFYMCNSLPILPFDSSMTYASDMSIDFPSSEFSSSDIISGRYMILPFLERTGETSNAHDIDDSILETMLASDATSFGFNFNQQSENTYLYGNPGEMDFFNPLMVFGAFPDPSLIISPPYPVLVPKDAETKHLTTLVLDLDGFSQLWNIPHQETLVHSTLEHCDEADFTITVFFNNKEHTVYVRRRPFLQIFLEKVAQMFEIVIFTASQSIYASQLLDNLDPENKIISKRMYRESCTFSDGNYTKDLRILGLDLAKVAIIDNSPQVFRLQVNNGIPIESWFDDQSDDALLQLLPFLETLVDAEDVRPLIARKFGNIY